MKEDAKSPTAVEKIVYSDRMARALATYKRKDKRLFQDIENRIEKIVREPTIGKPLRYTLKNRRRVHVGSFVLVYEFYQGELRFIDFDHHDKIYKKI